MDASWCERSVSNPSTQTVKFHDYKYGRQLSIYGNTNTMR